MATTTSLKLPDNLKLQIAWLADKQGKSAHALMVEALQRSIEDALLRQRLYEDADEAWDETLRSNIVYGADEVHQWFLAQVRREKSTCPLPRPLNPDKPMQPELLKLQQS